MPRKFFTRIMPDHKTIREHKHLQCFGTLIHDPNLWHLNRRSVSGAFAVGLFMAFVPLPWQMILAAAAAIPLRVNLPISVLLVWISNPVTMPPLFYGAYRLGVWVLGRTEEPFQFEASWEWLTTGLLSIWQPFLLGCLIAGILSAIAGFCGIRLLWRWQVIKAHKLRKFRKRA
jgi:uncharacterized protein (DUF2062 family)